MRYLLIDKILQWEGNEFIKGVKNVAMSEDFLEFHFPDRPVMPGVMLLEAMTQLTGWLVALSTDFTKWFLINQIKHCKFYSFALPGDQVILTVQRIENNKEGILFRGIGMVEEKKKLIAEFSGELIDLETIEEIENKRKEFRTLIRENSWR